MSNIKIALDAGHGSNTAGKRTPPFPYGVDINGDGIIDIKKGEQYREHYANVGVANLLYKKLVDRGYQVLKTGWNDSNAANDVDESLTSRQDKIKKFNADISISIHFNAIGDGNTFNDVEGVGIYIHNTADKDSKNLADFVLSELVKGTKQKSRGIIKQALSMCNCTTMNTKASILLELAFMTNLKEATQLIANAKFWEECATEIADGVDQYFKIKATETTIDKQQVTKIYYTVLKGDTLSKIAKTYNTTISNLVTLNKLPNPNNLNIGQKILIEQYKLYTVKAGNSLRSISSSQLGNPNRYTEIMKLNKLEDTAIYVNQVIKLPVD